MTISRPFLQISLLLTVVLITVPSHALSKKESEEAGAILFRDKGCAFCHGANAAGTTRGPSLADVRKTMKPEQIADQIQNGGKKMPSFKESVSKDEVDQLVAYLRAKNRPVCQPNPPAIVSNPAQ